MKKARPPQAVGPTKKHLARAERERMLARWMWSAVIALAVLVIGVLVFGYLNENVIKPGQPVATVGDAAITTGDFQKAVKFRRVQLIQQYTQIQQVLQYFGNDPSSAAYFQSQINQITVELDNTGLLGQTVLDDLIDDQLIRQEAERRGITASAEEVQARLEQAFEFYPNGTPTLEPSRTPAPTAAVTPTQAAATAALSPDQPTLTPMATLEPTATPALPAPVAQAQVSGAEGFTPGPSPTPSGTPTQTPTPTPYTTEAFKANLDGYLEGLRQQTGQTEADFRRQLESQILREKLFAVITADVPHEQDMVHARHILVDEEALARGILTQLESGEDFAVLAGLYSTDDSNKETGGDLGWFGQGRMAPEFERPVFNAPVGLIQEPVETEFGWHVVEVLGHEKRTVTDTEYQGLQQQAFADWLQSQREQAGVQTLDYWKERVPTEPALSPATFSPSNFKLIT